MKDGGQSLPSGAAELLAADYCDTINLLATGANVADGLTADGLRAGLSRLGQRFSPALSFGSALSGGRAYLPGAARDFGWQPSCKCFRYLSNTNVPI